MFQNARYFWKIMIIKIILYQFWVDFPVHWDVCWFIGYYNFSPIRVSANPVSVLLQQPLCTVHPVGHLSVVHGLSIHQGKILVTFLPEMFPDRSATDLKNDYVERLVSSSWNKGVWRIRRKRSSKDPIRKEEYGQENSSGYLSHSDPEEAFE